MITVIDPGLNPWLVAAALIVLATVAFAATLRRGLLALAGCFIFGILVGITIVAHEHAWAQAAVTALEAEGFTNIHLDGHEFTAADPLGLFFEGKLQHDRGNDWFLLEFTRGLI